METLSLVSLNIEKRRHIGRFIPFLQREQADVVCLQELADIDVPQIEKILGMKGVFAPMTHIVGTADNQSFISGIGIFSRLPIVEQTPIYYIGSAHKIPEYTSQNVNTVNYVLLGVKVVKNNQEFSVATTHFTWSPDGKLSPAQMQNLPKLLESMSQLGECVITGDFNTPRGGDAFAELAEKYHDNIPAEIKTTLDGNLHRAGPIERMVDGLFTTPGYSASDVKIVCGISDHCAVVAKLSLAQSL